MENLYKLQVKISVNVGNNRRDYQFVFVKHFEAKNKYMAAIKGYLFFKNKRNLIYIGCYLSSLQKKKKILDSYNFRTQLQEVEEVVILKVRRVGSDF